VENLTIAQRNAARFCCAGAWAAPVAALVFDARNVVFANDAALHRLGYSNASSLIGRAIDGVLHADVLPADTARREIVAGTHTPLLGMPTKLLSCAGAPRPEIADVFPIEIAGSTLTLFTLHAGEAETRHKPIPRPEEIGAIGPELGLAVLEAMALPILIQDQDTILFANAAARAHLGATDRSQIEGHPIMSIVHADGLSAAIERVGFVFATHQRLRRVPVKLRALDGRILHVEADAYPLRAGGQTAALLVGRVVR